MTKFENTIDNYEYEYDIALSFAGEDRQYVSKVANYLIELDIRVFYDEFEEVNLWGKDLYVYLNDIYKKQSRLCVIFISKYYKNKLWGNHERSCIQARAFEEKAEYLLPVRFDDIEIPGINKTIGYIDANEKTPEKLALLISKKLDKIITEEKRSESVITVPNKFQKSVSKIALLKKLVNKYFKNGALTENVLSENIKSLNFREEWQYIVNKLVSETKNELRAMVFDVELKKWWNSIAGQVYMMTNIDLIKNGIDIQRIFILSSIDMRIRKNALLNAYVHHKLGVNVKICFVDNLHEEIPFQADMFSVHDNFFLALYYFSLETPITNIVTESKWIIDFISFYDDFFQDERLCRKIESVLKQYSFSHSFFNEANNQLAMLKKISNTDSILSWIKEI